MIISELAELVYKTKACQSGRDFTLVDVEAEVKAPRGQLKMALNLLAVNRRIYSDYRDNRRKYLKASKHPLFGRRLANYEPPTTVEKEHISIWLTRERYE